MKSFKDFLEESKLENIKQGTKVKIKNAKSYNALAKSDVVDGVFDRIYKHSKGNFAMVKVGTGQYTVDFKDLVLNESKDFDILSENLDASKAETLNIQTDNGRIRLMGLPGKKGLIIDAGGKQYPITPEDRDYKKFVTFTKKHT